MALVTGAARGRGRSHALRLAWEGADVMLVDLCDNIPSCDYPLATSEDLGRTAYLIEELGRKAAMYRCDVCDRTEMENAVDAAVRQLGALDVVVANAAIAPTQPEAPIAVFVDTFDVDFIGVVNTFSAAMPRLREGASLIASGPTSSPHTSLRNRPQGLGGSAYELAQSMVSQYVKSLAQHLAPQGIRVNTVSGSSNGDDRGRIGRLHRPVLLDVNRRDHAGVASLSTMSWRATSWADTDASAAVAFLAADESRAITGRHVTVDAGSSLN